MDALLPLRCFWQAGDDNLRPAFSVFIILSNAWHLKVLLTYLMDPDYQLHESKSEFGEIEGESRWDVG